MAKYDGEIRIKAQIDSKEFNDQASNLINKLEEQTLKLEKQKTKVQELERQYKSFITLQTKTPEETNLEKSIKRAEKELKQLENSYKIAQGYMDIQKVAGGTIPPEILGDIKKYENLLKTIERLKEELKRIRLDPSSAESVQKLRSELELANLKSQNLENNISGIKSKLGNIDTGKLGNSIENLKNKILSLGETSSRSISTARSSLSSFGNRIISLARSAFVFNIISAGFREIAKGIGALVQADPVLNRSLQSIRFNLMTAFAPIYQYVLPALRTLMQALAAVTSKIAAFMSMLFGVSLKQSQSVASNMIQVVSNTNKSSKALKKNSKSLDKVGKSAKKASEELASFDKIQVLNLKTNEEAKDNYNIADEIPQNTIPDIPSIPQGEINVPVKFEVPEVETRKFEAIIERLKAPFKNIDYGPLNDSLKDLKSTLGEYTKDTGDGLWWVYEEILAPLGTWTMNLLVPAFLRMVNAALKAFKPVWDQVGDDIKWLWKDFLQPASEYTGNKLIEFLNKLTGRINELGAGIKQNKSLMEWFSAILIGLGTSLAIVGLINLMQKLTTGILAFNAAILANPWTWVVIGLTAIIAVIIQLTRHWDEMEQYFGNAWESFKSMLVNIQTLFYGVVQNISGWIDFLAGLFTGNWDRMWKGAGNVVLGAMNSIISSFNIVSNAINSIINFVTGGINLLIDKINSIGFDMPDWLGGASFHPNIPRIPNRALNIPNIPKLPRLAQGAVLEGGNPMLAYINDQPRGNTNIETPLNTMVEAFKTAMSSNLGNRNVVIEANGDMSGLISFLNLQLKKEEARIGNNMISGDVWV